QRGVARIFQVLQNVQLAADFNNCRSSGTATKNRPDELIDQQHDTPMRPFRSRSIGTISVALNITPPSNLGSALSTSFGPASAIFLPGPKCVIRCRTGIGVRTYPSVDFM